LSSRQRVAAEINSSADTGEAAIPIPRADLTGPLIDLGARSIPYLVRMDSACVSAIPELPVPGVLAELIDIVPIHANLIEQELGLIKQKRVLIVTDCRINGQRPLRLQRIAALIVFQGKIPRRISLGTFLPGQICIVDDLGLIGGESKLTGG